MAQPSYVWGFEFDGAATTEDMFFAVANADPRIYAKVSSPGAFGVSLFGIGYDTDGDGIFGITDGTVFGPSGLVTDPAARDSADPTDAGDLYEEGWLSEGFWGLGLSTGNPFDGGSWASAQTGISGETLQDGDWNSIAFAPGFAANSFAANPIAAAVPEPGSVVFLAVAGGWLARRRRQQSAQKPGADR